MDEALLVEGISIPFLVFTCTLLTILSTQFLLIPHICAWKHSLLVLEMVRDSTPAGFLLLGPPLPFHSIL